MAAESDWDLGGCATGTEVDRRQRVAHLVGRPAVIVADAKLAVAVETPALDLTVVEDSTDVEFARGHRGCAAAGPEIDSRQQVAHLAGVIATVVEIALAELAVAVIAPTLDLIIVE